MQENQFVRYSVYDYLQRISKYVPKRSSKINNARSKSAAMPWADLKLEMINRYYFKFCYVS